MKSGQKASEEENKREIRLTIYCKLFTHHRLNIFGIKFAVEPAHGENVTSTDGIKSSVYFALCGPFLVVTLVGPQVSFIFKK